jgi:hypothetical protein
VRIVRPEELCSGQSDWCCASATGTEMAPAVVDAAGEQSRDVKQQEKYGTVTGAGAAAPTPKADGATGQPDGSNHLGVRGLTKVEEREV